MASPDEILDYWFGAAPVSDPALVSEQMQRWYRGGPDVAREIRERFEADVEAALAGKYDAWESDKDARLALILLLDQFTRNLFAGTPRAFAGDPKAQQLALDAFDRHWPDDLTPDRRLFYVMPLMHAESVALLERCIAEIERLLAACPEPLRPSYAVARSQAEKYRDVIARFGRFPHRNAALGRKSTEAEQEFLASWQQAPAESK